MKILDRFKSEFEHLNNPAVNQLLSNIDVVDIREPLPKNINVKKTIFIGEKASVETMVPLFQKGGIEHFVQLDRDGFVYDLFAASVMLQKPDAFMKNPLPFFMNHFKPNEQGDNVRSSKLTFSSSEEKAPLLFQISAFLEENKKTSNFIESVHMIADEMIMNALYNAPVDDEGKPLFMNTDRANIVELPSNTKASIFITHDEHRLLIGCEDPYGSVSRFKIMNQFAKVFKSGQLPSPNEGTGGAGLGCKMMIESSCGFYMIVQQKIRTLVCCALPLGMSYTKAERMSKNLHFVFF